MCNNLVSPFSSPLRSFAYYALLSSVLLLFSLPPQVVHFWISYSSSSLFKRPVTNWSLRHSYARILSRINSLHPTRAQTKARRLLGFIGCSPAPLTIHELNQLLTLDLYEGLGKVTHPNRCSLNPIQLCGPIVEVVDEYVQFVHFTVKE